MMCVRVSLVPRQELIAHQPRGDGQPYKWPDDDLGILRQTSLNSRIMDFDSKRDSVFWHK